MNYFVNHYVKDHHQPAFSDWRCKGKENIKTKIPKNALSEHLRGIRGIYGACTGQTSGQNRGIIAVLTSKLGSLS
jgi:hypothetical protein